jgi:hypothetical protein
MRATFDTVELELRLREPSNSGEGCKALVLEAADALNDLRKDRDYWQKLAAYLAECHAATAESDGQLSRVSKYTRGRYASICESAAAGMRGTWSPRTQSTPERAGERCSDIAAALRQGDKPSD